jgi:2',3'-cyclic-nucleotide 2'-phosphodiesterase
MSKIIFFGDIMGRPGREALKRTLPELRDQYQPDVVIVNVENLAHGKGITPSTLAELQALDIDVFTSGNHVFDKSESAEECFGSYPHLIRPVNYEGQYPGSGWYRLHKQDQNYLVINLNGQVFFDQQFRGVVTNPFTALDELLLAESRKDDIIVVDFHAEATSEKKALGWHADGRVAVLLGTHTHVPTADTVVLPQGTAYVTDVGMTGPRDSVIGVKIENALKSFVHSEKFVMDVAETPVVSINAVYIETNGPKAVKIERVQREITV